MVWWLAARQRSTVDHRQKRWADKAVKKAWRQERVKVIVWGSVLNRRKDDGPVMIKPRLRGTRASEGLARGQLAELHFWKSRQVSPYQSNSQNFFKFYCHFLGRRARGVFSVPLAFAKKFCPLAEKRGSLEGIRERGFKVKGFEFRV